MGTRNGSSDPRTARRRAVPWCTLACGLLSGCLTRALDDWAYGDIEVAPDRTTIDSAYEVESARGALTDSGRELVLSVEPKASAVPRHLELLARNGPAMLYVRPRLGHFGTEAWPADASDVSAFSVDVFGERQRSTMNARVTLYGTVDPEAVGAIVPPIEAPSDGDPDDPWFVTMVQRCYEGFEEHDWVDLIEGISTGAGASKRTPIGFVGPDGAPLSAAEIDEALIRIARDGPHRPEAECGLVGRVDADDGTSRFVRVTLPVLLQAHNLRLERRGDRILFAHSQPWRGRFVTDVAFAKDFDRVATPMLDGGFVYHWTTENPPSTVLTELIHTIARPIAQVIDFVLQTSPFAPMRELFIDGPPKVQDPNRHR